MNACPECGERMTEVLLSHYNWRDRRSQYTIGQSLVANDQKVLDSIKRLSGRQPGARMHRVVGHFFDYGRHGGNDSAINSIIDWQGGLR